MGGNALLATPLPEYLLNGSPASLQFHYSRAWTVLPLRFEVRDLRVLVQDPLVQVAITADTARGDLRPWALKDLRFVANQLEAEGVTFHLRPRDRTDSSGLCEVPEFDGPDGVLTPEAAALRPLFSLQFSELTAHHVREIWIDRVRYVGDAEVTGGMLYEPFRRLRLDDVQLTDTNAELHAAEPQRAQLESVALEVSLREVDLTRFQFDDLQGLDAHLSLAARSGPGFMNVYLAHVAGVPGLQLEGKDGPLALELHVKAGRLADGVLLTWVAPRSSVRLPWFSAVGDLRLHAATSVGQLRFGAVVSEATVQRGPTLSARAREVTVTATSDADLRRLPLTDAVLTVSDLHVKDLRSLHELLPPGQAMRIAAGEGRLDLTLAFDASPRKTHGELRLGANDVVLKNRGATIGGRLALLVKLRSLDLDTGATDLSGTSLKIEDATVHAGSGTWVKQQVTLRLDRARLNPRGPLLATTFLDVTATNLQPLFALFAENVEVPKVLGVFTESPDAHFTAQIQVSSEGVVLPSLRLVSKRVGAQGVVALRPLAVDSKVLAPFGWVVVRLGVLDVGVVLEGEKVSVVDARTLAP